MSVWPHRLLMTADTVGGVWTFALELASSFLARGMEVTLATSGGPLSRQQRAEAREAGNPTILESNFRLEWQDDPWTDVDRTSDWLWNIVERIRPDVLHLNAFSHASCYWTLPVVVTGHSCVLSWFSAVKKSAAPAQWNEYRRRVAAGLHWADVVTVPSRAMLDCLEEHYGLLDNAVVIRNGRNAKPFYRAPKEPFILAAGRLWDEAKNIAALAKAAPRLPWPVMVAGETNGAFIPNVRWLGKLDIHELAQWMAKASIYCLPAKYEPFGLSILEAGLSGCALVLGDIDSLREIWGGSAQFVDPDDATALQRELADLIGNAGARAQASEDARKRALEYGPEKMAEGYLKAYAAARNSAHTSRRGAVLTA